MAGYSTYPTSFDSTFPGYPYVDNTEYLDQTQANAWVSAIQNIETTIGYGSIGNPASPLYSAAYSATYATLTARIAATESKVLNGLTVNSSNAVIQSVGSTNQAGSSGLAADAAHVHASSASASSYVPVGGVIIWPGPIGTIPGGGTYFQCNGQLVSISTYGTLYTALGSGSVYGTSGGSFFLPNLNDKFPIGVNATAPAPGATGGSRTITTNNLPAHNHPAGAGDSGHAHQISNPFGAGTGFMPLVGQEGFSGTWAAAGNGSQYGAGGLGINWDNVLVTQAATANVSVNIGNTGAGFAYDQPYLGVYFLVRAL